MQQGKNIDTITLKELFRDSTEGSFPILVDIRHEDIVWKDSSNSQENGHLRLINSEVPVVYNTKHYLASHFEFTQPQEDGVKVGDTSISISAVDKRIVEVIRSIKSNPKCIVEAFYTTLKEGEDTVYAFSKLYKYEFMMKSCSWDSVTAQWNLVFDPSMQINIPKDTATLSRCPSITENEK